MKGMFLLWLLVKYLGINFYHKIIFNPHGKAPQCIIISILGFKWIIYSCWDIIINLPWEIQSVKKMHLFYFCWLPWRYTTQMKTYYWCLCCYRKNPFLPWLSSLQWLLFLIVCQRSLLLLVENAYFQFSQDASKI